MKMKPMYIRKIKYKEQIYYYLARKLENNSNQEERLSTIGSLMNPTTDQEHQLLACWALQLISGTERASQRTIEAAKAIAASREGTQGKSFDIDQCLAELRTIYLKYGKISKSLLEKQARPKGELSWGTSTLTNQFRNRGMTWAQALAITRKSSN